jgi:hypothetical protein
MCQSLSDLGERGWVRILMLFRGRSTSEMLLALGLSMIDRALMVALGSWSSYRASLVADACCGGERRGFECSRI